MAKSTDSFFIRARVPDAATIGAFTEVPVDMSAFVDALGKSIVRIHNIHVQYPEVDNTPAGAGIGEMSWQLTTQSFEDLTDLDNRQVISSGSCTVETSGAGAGNITFIDETLNVGPQEWTNGYLIAVETLFLGVNVNSSKWAAVMRPDTLSLVIECTVETMTQSSAMALALSQQ